MQLFGGVGNPAAEAHAARLTQRFADLTGARADVPARPRHRQLRSSARGARWRTASCRRRSTASTEVTLALVGIGALEPSSLLQSSGNIFSDAELRALGEQGAVGDICLRFFDADGERVESDVDRRVIGVTLEQLRGPTARVGIAGGERKYEAIRGALRGGWINVLITDTPTAERLLGRAHYLNAA